MKYFVEVKKTKNRGRGVFALKDFRKNEIIEICPIIYFNTKDTQKTNKTVLDYYLYEWGSENKSALVLGYGSIYNHSYTPNATYNRKIKNDLMIYKCINEIKTGQEITVNYQGHPKNKKKITWFKVL